MFPPTAITPNAESAPAPIQFELPKDIPTRAELRELQNQLSLQSAHKLELENILTGITDKISGLQESLEGATKKIHHVESNIPKIDVKQIDGLQKELALLLQTVEQLEDSHTVPSYVCMLTVVCRNTLKWSPLN